MGSETIRIYIPLEVKRAKVENFEEVNKFKDTCINFMDSITSCDVTKYFREKDNKVVVLACECITLYGRIQWFKDSIKEELIKLAIKLNLDHIHVETCDINESITHNDIKCYKYKIEQGE